MLLYFLLVSARFNLRLSHIGTDMSQIHAQYLQEMGITQWELSHPERLSGYQTELVKLPETCQLLLVSPEKPQGALAEMFERVLKSIKLELSQAQYVHPSELSHFDLSSPQWVWFAGCESDTDIAAKTLQSPLLSQIDGNNQQRRALWQQICSYE